MGHSSSFIDKYNNEEGEFKPWMLEIPKCVSWITRLLAFLKCLFLKDLYIILCKLKLLWLSLRRLMTKFNNAQ